MKIGFKNLLWMSAIGGAIAFVRKQGGVKQALDTLAAKKDELLAKQDGPLAKKDAIVGKASDAIGEVVEEVEDKVTARTVEPPYVPFGKPF